MSWTVRILIVFWLCFISVSEAGLGASCNVNDTSSCTETIESCIGDSCECSSGHFNVSNVCKSSSITVKLTPQSGSVVYGSTVTLTATITSEVPLNPIKWLKGSTELDISSLKYTQSDVGPGTVTLTVNNVDFTDSGNYQVEVSNIAETTSTSNQVSLNVTGVKPTVIVPMTISEIGTTVTIHCTANVSQGSPALTAVYWLFNGKNLDISNSNKYSGGIVNNASLSIKNLASTDAGVYHCGATNLLGSTNSSQSVTLAPPSVSVSQPANPVYNGTRITFSGSYNSTLLNVKSIKWQRMNGNAISDINITEDKYNESTDTGSNPTLVIKKVDFIDKASFRLTVSNGAGITPSEAVDLNVIDGSISVTLATTSNSARYGSDVILVATITSTASVNPIKWQKVSSDGNLENLNITLSKYIQNGVGPGAVTLTIKNVTFTDGGSYQVEVSNAAGNTGKSEKVSFSVKVGQFDESCTDQQICNTSKNLECTKLKRCRCTSTFYHNNQLCYQKSRLAPIIIHLNSTTATLSVFWSPPTIDSELVSKYEVTWKVKGASSGSSAHLDNSKSRYTVPSGLMSGQIYILNVISHVNLTNPEQTIVVTSADFKERLTPLAPGPIIMEQSNFAYDNLQIRWTKPSNTFVTGYEVIIDDIKYPSSSELIQFNGKNFTPGKYYNVTIVTVSGITDVKKSVKYTKEIRITPTKPEPPRDVRCPEVPLDVSLQISWKAPNNSNGVILQYQITIHLNNPRVINVSSTDLSKNVEGLSPEQSYIFSVRTINDAEESISVSEPSTISCTTKAGVSSPPTSLVLEDVKSREFLITFGVPTNVSGILAGYKIVVQQESECIQQILVFESQCNQCVNTTSGCPDPLNFDVDNISMPVSYPARGLNPHTTYFVKVTAINGVGEGYYVNATASTDEEVPKTPEQITASNILSRSLTLSWNLSAPSPGDTIYTIFVYEANDEGIGYKLKENLTVYGFSTQSTSVTGLEEYWQYKFKVNAATGKGSTLSEFSNNFRTLQAAPGQVEDLTVGKIKDDYRTAYVSWSLPALRKHNGVLVEYLFSISNDEVTKLEEIPVSLSNTKVERNISVMPETTYVVTVILQNNETMNSSTSSQKYFASAGPPPVSNMEPIDTKPGGHNPTENTITVKINTNFFKNEYNGKQVFFGIAVCEASKCTGLDISTFQDYWKNLPNWHKASKSGFPMYRVTNITYMEVVRQGALRRKRSTGSETPFIIGEDNSCASYNESVYCNGPLSPGTTYSVIIFGCTSGGCTYSKAAGPYETKKIPEDFPIGIIVGVVVAVVAVAVIVGVAFVVVRRRNRLGETKKYTKGLENPTTLDEPVTKNIPRKRPIKLKELSERVAEKHKDSNLHFAREYEDLKALSPKHPAETSELDNNKLKNRYVNILPFDHSRVKLMLTEDDDPSTDFINANYLPGYKSQREYIATQGPIPGTIDDFWRMIWEQNVSIIVMLTLCKEEGRVKCEMYWPENIHEPKQYGDLVVETVSNSTVNFYEFRIFKIKLGDTTRSVKHFHFLQWKDFSANVQNDVMIDFIKNVRNHIRPPDMNGPVVVHCSAGVGRTGTYCALDHLFQFVDEHDLDESIDIFDLVMNLRERRMFMVQTEQQYVFIHDCVRDYVERKKKELQGNLLYENVNRGFVADDEPVEESLYQNYSNQRTDL